MSKGGGLGLAKDFKGGGSDGGFGGRTRALREKATELFQWRSWLHIIAVDSKRQYMGGPHGYGKDAGSEHKLQKLMIYFWLKSAGILDSAPESFK